jgi:hypothetical protein
MGFWWEGDLTYVVSSFKDIIPLMHNRLVSLHNHWIDWLQKMEWIEKKAGIE